MKRPVMRDLYAVAVAFLGPHCVKWWRRYLAQGIAGLEKPQPSPQAFTINENRHLRSRSDSGVTFSAKSGGKTYSKRVKTTSFNLTGNSNNPQSPFPESGLNRPGFPGECFICELRLPDHRFRWKHNKLFLLLPEEYGPAFPAIVDCYTSPPT